MNKLKAILIDDDQNFCRTFQSLAENTFDLKIAHTGKDGLKLMLKASKYSAKYKLIAIVKVIGQTS